MTPSWYDVLGVDPSAGPTEIRARWKDAVADLDPTDRRFRMLNRAAEVLLDEDRRAAHDRELALSEPDEPDEPDQPVEPDRSGDSDAPAEDPSASSVTHDRGAGSPRWAPSLLVTVLTGVVALALAVTAGFVVSDDTFSGSSSSAASSGSSGDLPDAQQVAAARAAAEAAVVPVLSYDFRRLEQDKQAALSYMTPSYAAQYEQLFESIIAVNAPSTETVVSVEVLASGIVRTGPGLVDVLLFVNRPTVNREQTTPEIYKDQATLRMREVSGEWLVDCLISGAGGTCEE